MFEKRLERFEAHNFDEEHRADDLSKQLEKCRADSRSKDDKMAAMKRRVKDLDTQLNKLEQYLQQENIRIVGISKKERETAEESEKKEWKFIEKELGSEDGVGISKAHRVGKQRAGEG